MEASVAQIKSISELKCKSTCQKTQEPSDQANSHLSNVFVEPNRRGKLANIISASREINKDKACLLWSYVDIKCISDYLCVPNQWA